MIYKKLIAVQIWLKYKIDTKSYKPYKIDWSTKNDIQKLIEKHDMDM